MILIWIILIILGMIILIIFILALIGYFLDKSEDDESFISRTVSNVKKGCGKLMGKRGC